LLIRHLKYSAILSNRVQTDPGKPRKQSTLKKIRETQGKIFFLPLLGETQRNSFKTFFIFCFMYALSFTTLVNSALDSGISRVFPL